MPKSLLFKLLGAFLLVTVIGSAVMAILTSLATRDAFSIYTTRNGEAWAQNLAPQLAAYYEQNSSWQGVDQFIQSVQTENSMSMSAGQGMGAGHGNGSGNGNGSGMGRQMAGYGMMGGAGQRIILTDANSRVLVDTDGELSGQVLSAIQMKYGVDIFSGQAVIGKVLVTPLEIAGSGTPAGDFLAAVNRAILSSAVIATVLALILGTLLFRQMIHPLRKLKTAASQIEHGDLTGRVDIQSSDEFQEVGQAFNRMAASLARAENQRKQMMADVAHELRTPLTAIQGTVEAMQDGLLPSDAEQLDAIYSQTNTLNRLINDLRLLSLAEAGQLKLVLEPVDLAELVTSTVDGLRPLAGAKSVTIHTEVPQGLAAIRLDRDRIVQVLNNLVSNSIRYSPAESEIEVTVKMIHDHRWVEVEVTDGGTGIEPADLPFIFDRFYRADKSRTRSSGGSGLGLAIVKQLVEAHGGTVRAESPVRVSEDGTGAGTRIIVSLPTNH
jgi:signal transduction histidine kinase